MTSSNGILYIILPRNHSFHFLTGTPPPLHLPLQITIPPFLSFFNDLQQQSPFCIHAICPEPLFSPISPEFVHVGCRCALITEDDGAYGHQSPVQSPSAALHQRPLSLPLHMQGAFAERSPAVVGCGWIRQKGQAVAVIPQKADTKWLNQFITNAAKSSGERRKTNTGRRGEAEREE